MVRCNYISIPHSNGGWLYNWFMEKNGKTFNTKLTLEWAHKLFVAAGYTFLFRAGHIELIDDDFMMIHSEIYDTSREK